VSTEIAAYIFTIPKKVVFQRAYATGVEIKKRKRMLVKNLKMESRDSSETLLHIYKLQDLKAENTII
jgi:hypothetical protein